MRISAGNWTNRALVKDSDFEPAGFPHELSAGYLPGLEVKSGGLYANYDLNSFGSTEMPRLRAW